MRRLLVAAGLQLSLAACTLGAGEAAAAPVAAAPVVEKAPAGSVEITLDQTRVETTVGTRLSVTSRMVNTGTAPTDPLVAHLNVASLDGVYTDLEDWSADVTRSVPPLAPGGHTSLTWQFQAVNTGNFDVYVAVLPSGPGAGQGPLVVSPPLHVKVAGRTTVSAGGALPVVLAIPILLGSAAGAAWLRRRRRERRN
ncbi:MAG TPA: hypothetical protein VGJ53_21185 [Micromonosporaceae bacterium]|jgi:hypothetical protein